MKMQGAENRPRVLTGARFHYCPGCGHTVIHRLIAEVVDALGIRGRTIGIAPVGCAVFAYHYFDLDMLETAHGRGPAAATGMKRVLPDRIVFSYQGDGDLASIGIAEIVHAAARSENISVFFVNNATYGMTGGQMAPTTLPGQVTTTTHRGREVTTAGHPIRMVELLGGLAGPVLLARTAVDSPVNVRAARELIERSFRCQMQGKGFSMIEILSACPVNWGKTPAEAAAWLRETMMQAYPLGVIRDGT